MASHIHIKVGTPYGAASSLEGAVMEMARECADENKRALKANVKAAGEATVKELQATSPVLSGTYKSGWVNSMRVAGDGHVSSHVHNTTKPSLTHLLEFGHVKVLWGHRTHERVKAIPHIAPAYQHAAPIALGGKGGK